MTYKNTDPLRNISILKTNGRYLLRKTKESTIIYSETFKHLAEAILVRDELEKADYDVDLI